MAYADDVDSRYHNVGFYVRFEGIPTRFSTHDPARWPNWSPSETFEPAIIRDSMSGGMETLNREFGVVEQGSFSFRLMNSDTVQDVVRIRGGTVDYLGTQAGTASNITLASGGAWAGGLPATVYVDRETITLTAHTGSGVHSCTRGAEGSPVKIHQEGAVVSDVPRYWYTRRATVYAVNLDTGTEAAVFTGSMSASPVFNDGAWDVELVGVINDYLKRPLCTGWQEQQAISAAATASGGVTFEVSNANNFTGEDLSYIRVEAGGKVGLYGGQAGDIVISTATNPHTVTLLYNSYRAGDLMLHEMPGEACTLREVALVTGRPGHMALQVMLSDLGDGTVDSNYDILAGRDFTTSSSNDFLPKRMGAAIPPSFIDVDSFQEMPSGHHYSVWLDEETELGSFLADEVLRFAGGYVHVTPAGVLTFKLYEPAVPTGTLTIYTRGELLESNTTTLDDETGRLGRAVVECNYSPLTREYGKRVELVFQDDSPIYGARGVSASWRSKSVWIGPLPFTGGNEMQVVSDPQDVIDVEVQFDRQRARQSEGGRRSSFLVPWRYHHTLTVGTRLRITHEYMPDHEGGMGVTARTYEVTGRQIDFGNGDVKIDVDEVPAGWLLAPSAVVGAWDAGTRVLTLAPAGAGAELSDDAKPGNDFPVNCTVRLYDLTDDFATSATATVSAVTDTTLTLSSSPTLSGGGAPAAGDLVILEDSANTGNTNDVGADVHDFAFGANSSFQVGSGGYTRAGPKWS